MKRTKLVALVGLVAMTAGGLAACGGDGDAPTEAGATTGSTEGATLQVMMSPHSLTDMIQDKLPEFEEETGINVEITSLNEDQVSQQLRVEFGSGNAATDVFLYRPLQDAAQFDNNGWMMDLTDLVENDTEFNWGDFGERAQEAVTSRDGNIISVPVATARQMLFYRKDLLDEAGVDVPTNLEEFEAAAAALDSDDVAGVCLRGQRAQAVTTFAQFLYAFDGDWNEGGDPYGPATVNTPEAVEAFAYYGDLLRNYGPDGVLNMSWAECSALFSQGRVALYIEGDDRWPEYTDPEKSTLAEDQVGYAVSPALTSVVPAQALGIAAGTANPEAAWEFVRWATSIEMSAEMQGIGVMGARDSAWESQQTKDTFPQEVIDAVVHGNEVGIPYDRPRIVAVGEARDAIGGALVSAIEGSDVQAAADTANSAFQQLIDQERLEFGLE